MLIDLSGRPFARFDGSFATPRSATCRRRWCRTSSAASPTAWARRSMSGSPATTTITRSRPASRRSAARCARAGDRRRRRGAAVDQGDAVSALAILDLGYGNTRSVALAFERLGAADPVGRSGSGRAGGAAGPARASAPPARRWSGCAQPGSPRRFAQPTGPTLGICLGMQLLFERSRGGWRHRAARPVARRR